MTRPTLAAALLAAGLTGVAGIAGVAGVAGCGPSEEKLEKERVLRAIDVLRDAPSEPASAREALVADLEKMPVKGEAPARARDACARAYRLLIEGKALQKRVEEQLKPPAGGAPSGATLDTLRDLAEAESKIGESKARMEDCASEVAALRRGLK